MGDLDGDLDLDLAVANFLSGDVSVLLNNGDGTFATDITYGAGTAPVSVAMGDLDGDLDLDLATANRDSDDVSVLLNNGDGTYAADVLYGAGAVPRSVAIGDLDGDLDLDLAVANRNSHNISVLLNNGDGSFAADVTYAFGAGLEPYFVAMGDLDGDLDLDLVTANIVSDDVSVLLNECVNTSIVIVPDLLAVFRGFQIGGTLEDVFESDDSWMLFNPGFTINSIEAPVWLIFDGTLPNDHPGSLLVVMESQAGTPGLTATLEAWNWTLAAYDVIDVSSASFNNDTIVDVDLSSGISDYVESSTAAVRTRVGWRKTGLTINFPWEVRLDQMVWIVE